MQNRMKNVYNTLVGKPKVEVEEQEVEVIEKATAHDFSALANNPLAVSARHVNWVGEDYLALHPKKRWLDSHKSQDLAERLVAFNGNTSAKCLTELLEVRHAIVLKKPGELSRGIDNVLTKVFNLPENYFTANKTDAIFNMLSHKIDVVRKEEKAAKAKLEQHVEAWVAPSPR